MIRPVFSCAAGDPMALPYRKLREKSQMLQRCLPIALFALFLASCGSMALPLQPTPPGAGIWELDYMGDCQAREAEAIHITHLDEQEIAFGDFHLLRDEAGQYSGSASFIAPMPVDGREIGYIISYSLRHEAAGFAGEQRVVEGGGHGISCPITLEFRESAP